MSGPGSSAGTTGRSGRDRSTRTGLVGDGDPVRGTITLLALSAVVSHALARSTYPILLPAIEADLLSSHQQSGILTTVNFGAYMVGVAAVTAISGRLEPIRLLWFGLATAALGFVVLSQAQGFVTLAVGQGLAGIGSAGIWLSVPILATGAVAANRRGTVMGLLSSTMGLGIVAASQGTRVMRQIEGDDSAWRPTWVAAAVYAIVLLVVVVALLRTPPTVAISGGVSLRLLRTVPAWAALVVGYWLFGIIVSSFSPFFGAALEEEGFSRSHVANLYTAFGLAAAMGAVVLGRVSDRIGRRPVLVGALVVIVGASLLVLTGREPFAAISAVLFGAASFTFPVLVAAYLSDHLTDRSFSNALGALTLIYGSAMALGPFVAGTLGDTVLGFDVVFAGLAGLALLAAVAIARLPGPVDERRAERAVVGR